MSGSATFRAKLRSNGRIQVPKEVRESEGLEDGDFVDVEIIPLKEKIEGKKERRGG